MSGFSIIAILKEIITFNKESMHFFEQKYKLKNKTESKMENCTHSFRESNLVLQFI